MVFQINHDSGLGKGVVVNAIRRSNGQDLMMC